MPCARLLDLMQHEHRLLGRDGDGIVGQRPQVGGHEEGPGMLVLVVLGHHVYQAGALWQEDHVAYMAHQTCWARWGSI